MTRVFDQGDGAELNQEKNRGTIVADYVITWTSGEPTPASARTVADGAIPTVLELGKFMADMTDEINSLKALLKAQGIMKAT